MSREDALKVNIRDTPPSACPRTNPHDTHDWHVNYGDFGRVFVCPGVSSDDLRDDVADAIWCADNETLGDGWALNLAGAAIAAVRAHDAAHLPEAFKKLVQRNHAVYCERPAARILYGGGHSPACLGLPEWVRVTAGLT